MTRPEPQPVGGNTGQNVSFSLLQIEDYSSLERLLGVSASASVKAITGSIGGKSSFLRTVSVNDYSIYALASVKVENNPIRMRDVEFNDSAKRLIINNDDSRFQRLCGDEFVTGKISGGEFHAVIEIKTNSVEDQRTISGRLSGSYGVFSGSGEFAEVLTEISRTNRLQVFAYSSGGNSQVIPISPEGMIDRAVNFPEIVSGDDARPIIALTQSYETLPLPDEAPNPLDLVYKDDVIEDLSSLINRKLKLVSNIEYVLGNQEEFVDIDVEQLNDAISKLRNSLNILRSRARECYRDYNNCGLPENIDFPAVNLPQRIDSTETPCSDPIYNEKQDPLCGISSYNTARGPICGVDLHFSASGPVCGVENFKLGRGSVCGVESYKEASHPDCGVVRDSPRGRNFCRFERYNRCDFVVKGCVDTYEFCEFRMPDIEAANKICRDLGWDFAVDSLHSSDFRNPDHFEGFRNFLCARNKVCRTQANGVERYKECRDESFGVESYKTCRHPSFGVEQYKECQDPSFGVGEYKTCRRPEFGFQECRD
ncbi:MAG: hypothetical protein AAFN40_04910 [Cyanobacteria bacterium J06560_6]